MWIFAVAALMPEQMETFLARGRARHSARSFCPAVLQQHRRESWRRRPVAVLTVILSFLVLGILTYLGTTSPWSPQMNAWTSDPTETSRVMGRSPLELTGLNILQYKQCRNCHAIDGVGGMRGPGLSPMSARA